MSNQHEHHHLTKNISLRLGAVLVLNLVITAVELVGGIISGSLALISDALHNFSDATAVGISYMSIKIGERTRDLERTFGYRRAEIIGAVINSTVLLVIVAYLFYEAYRRFLTPSPIRGGVMFTVALVGLAANSFAVVLLHTERGKSLNIRAAYLHLLADAISSLGVIAAGLMIYFYGIYWLDPLLTVVIALYVAWEALDILREATNVVMQGTPPELELEEIKQRLIALEKVLDVHHTHLWSLTTRDAFFEAHVKVEDMPISESEKITRKIESILAEEFDINHVTLQYEHNSCEEDKLL